MKKRMIVACLSFICSAQVMADANALKENCAEITPSNYSQFMKSDVAKAVENPFANERENKSYFEDHCMLLTHKSKAEPELGVESFAGSERVHKTYEKFIRGEGDKEFSNITMDYDPESNQLFTFFKFTDGGHGHNEYKKLWSKNKMLMAHYEDFIFLHELMHTDSEITMSKIPRNEKESMMDIAAVIMIQSSKELSASQTYALMKQLDRARKTKVPTYNPRRRSMRKEVDHDHLHKENFSEALNFFEKMKDNDINLRVTSFQEARDLARSIANDGYEVAYTSVKSQMEKQLVQERSRESNNEEVTLGM
jgi:hypothetical protein